MMTAGDWYLATLCLILFTAAVALLLGSGVLHRAPAGYADDQLAPIRQLTVEFRPCLPCGSDTLATVHADGSHTCLDCRVSHRAVAY